MNHRQIEVLSPEQKETVVDAVLFLDTRTYVYGGLFANSSLVFDEIERSTAHDKWDIFKIRDVAVRCAQSGMLAVNAATVSIFQSVFSDPQFQPKAGVVANDNLILKEIIARKIYPPDNPLDEEKLSQVVIDIWDDLSTNPEAAASQEATRRRLRQISDMTDGRTRGFSVQWANKKSAYNADGTAHDPMAGQARGLSMGLQGAWSRGAGSKSFEEMTNEEVDAIYQAWAECERLKNMSPADLRKLVRANGSTDLFNKNVHAPNSVPGPQDRLHHPVTGEAFTQKTLIRFINRPEDPYAGRKLITHPSSGKVVPRLKALFEKTIRGDFEDRP